MRSSGPRSSDQTLMRLLETKPAEAMETLVAQYTALVCHEAAKYLEDPEDVKECVNDVFTEVYLHRADYDPDRGSLAAWIGTIARNRAISSYRRRAKEISSRSAADLEEMPSGADGISSAEQALDLEQAVSQLSETDQQIIRMKYYEDMSISEIAESLHIPYETAKKRHTRSIKQLRRLLLFILALAALLILAACGVIQLLRHLGLLPGYGVTSDPDAACYLMQERTPTVEAEEYTAWIKSAKLYNGALSVEYLLEVPEQPFETEYTEFGVATTTPLHFEDQLCYEDGTPVPYYPGGWGSVSDYFHGSGELTLEEDALNELAQDGAIALELHLVNIVFDGRAWPDAVIPFTLVEVQEQSMENYPTIYGEDTGGFLLDGYMDNGVLTVDIYPISNDGGTMEFYSGLTLPPLGVEDPDACQVLTIVGEDGTEYTGSPADGASYFYDNEPASFTFPDAPPGRYTLKLPYVYLLMKQDGALTWNLQSCKVSDQVVSFPGGSFRTVSITEVDDPVQLEEAIIGVPAENTHIWEIVVQCTFDNGEITALLGGYPEPPRAFRWVDARSMVRYLLFGEVVHPSGDCSVSPGWPDPESGTLIYRIILDDQFMQTSNLKRVRCNPAPRDMGGFSQMVLRYDHPMELEFEAAP